MAIKKCLGEGGVGGAEERRDVREDRLPRLAPVRHLPKSVCESV